MLNLEVVNAPMRPAMCSPVLVLLHFNPSGADITPSGGAAACTWRYSLDHSLDFGPRCPKAWLSVWSFGPWLHHESSIISSREATFKKCVKLHSSQNWMNTNTGVKVLMKWAYFSVKH